MLVNIIAELLIGRSDAASILAAAAVRLAPIPATPGSIAGLHAKAPASPPAAPASPPTVRVVSELTRAEKDAALLAQATDLSLGSPGSDLSAAPSPLLTDDHR